MILKASQRGFGQNLAVHLLNARDNEHVRVHQLFGFAADDLPGAFREAEAASRGTKCQQYLFSLSLSPPESAFVSIPEFESAIDRIEKRVGLEGQPRAIVFHEKDGRRHAHCVWSRIDARTMTARPMAFFKTKLSAMSRELYLEHGWQMPRGLENAAERNPTNFTLAEWQQARRQEMDPRWLKQAIQGCWASSDTTQSFSKALGEKGFFLAKGDRRSFVVVDHTGDVWSLPRCLGQKTKDVRARLGEGAGLPEAVTIQAMIGTRMGAQMQRHIAEARVRFRKRSATLGLAKADMTHRHRHARDIAEGLMAQHWTYGQRERAARLPRGLKGIWWKLTGKARVIQAQNLDEATKQQAKLDGLWDQLIAKQRAERAVLQADFRELRKRQAELLLELRHDVGRYFRLQFADHDAPGLSWAQGMNLKLKH